MAGLCVVGISYIPPVIGIPGVEDIPVLIPSNNKTVRGFNHHATARLLCPRHLRDEFDEDRDLFCREVNEGKRIITHNDWPSFLYEEDKYNPDALDEGLLRRPLLVSVSRCSIVYLCMADFL